MQPPPREVRIDECEREELRLAKQRKRMAVFRNADHPRRSARLQVEQLRLQQLTLLTLPCTWPTVDVPRLLTVMSRVGSKVNKMRARGVHCEYVHLVIVGVYT